MKPPIDFETHDGYACYRPSGEVTFNLAVAMISDAISQAVEKDIRRLVVDTTRLTGFPHPTTSERFFMAEQWAARSRGLRLAVIARPEMIDPVRFGIMVARNRGLMVNVFPAEPEAVGWLMHPDPE